jgi:methylated-DNA-[protein]-cysteine S-methyltransferase
VDSPVGVLTLVAAAGVLCGLYLDQRRHPPVLASLGEPDAEAFAECAGQLADYFAGLRAEFDLPVALAGTPFQLRVWAALREIPFGETVTDGELAARIGRPTGPRVPGRLSNASFCGVVTLEDLGPRPSFVSS